MLLVPSCVFPALNQFKCFVLSATYFYVSTLLECTHKPIYTVLLGR